MRVWVRPDKHQLYMRFSGTKTKVYSLSNYWELPHDDGNNAGNVEGHIISLPQITDGSIYSRITAMPDSSCYNGCWAGIGCRTTSFDHHNFGDSVYPFGYWAWRDIYRYDGAWRLSTDINGGLGATGTPDSNDARVRLEVEGTSIRVKFWDPSSSEPSTWSISVTDDTFSSGEVGWVRMGEGSTVYIYPFGIDYGGFSPPTGANIKTISGQVTLNGSPVQGATVIAVRQGHDFSKPGIPGIDFAKATTDANGNYTINLDCDTGPYAVFAFYESGGVKYTDQAKPFIEV